MQPENTGISSITLISASLYFFCDCATTCLYFAKQHEIYTNTCLSEGYMETLQLGISDDLDNGFCKDSYLTITVGAAIPLYKGNTSEVQVDTCSSLGTTVDVLPLTFSNSGDCVKQWNCTVDCTNDRKIFWVGDGLVIQTFTDSIDFDKEYIVEVTCVEKDIITPTISSDNTHIYYLNFIENSTSCTNSITTQTLDLLDSTPSNKSLTVTTAFQDYSANVDSVSAIIALLTSSSANTNTNTVPLVPATLLSGHNADDDVPFFENTGNVAAVTAVGGVVGGSVLGAGLYTLGKTCIAKK